APIKGDRPAPPVGGDGSVGPAGNVGGYNTFWLDPGSRYSIINGERRTSIVVDPPTGKVPPLTAEARQRNAARVVRTTSDEGLRGTLGRGHAGRRYDQLHRQDPVQRREREPARHRALLARRRGHAAVPIHDRRSNDLDAAMDRRIHVAGDQGALVRVRVPRGE